MRLEAQPQRRPLVVFFVLAFAISWSFWLLAVLLGLSIQSPWGRLLETAGNFGPLFAALIVIFFQHGVSGLRTLLKRLFAWRVPGKWYGFALVGPFVLMAGAITVSMALGGPAPSVEFGTSATLLALLPAFVRTLLIAGGLNEETGWRGYALPRLLARSGALASSVLLGVLWGVWHVPLYFLSGTGQNDMIRSGGSFPVLFAAFVVWTIALSILFTWLHEMVQGNLPILILFHAAINTAAALPSLLGVQASPASLLYPAFTWIAAIIVSRGRPFVRSRGTVHTLRGSGHSG